MARDNSSDRYRLHALLNTMKQRCYNPNRANFKWYGGKGIVVCDMWLESFDAFHHWAITNGYKQGLSIDRIDSDSNYSPSNCRWITIQENVLLSRNGSFGGENHPKAKLTFDSVLHIRQKTMPNKAYCELYNVDRTTISKLQNNYTRWPDAIPDTFKAAH